MGKWTDEGFVANTLESYKDQLRAMFVEAYGDDFLWDEATPQGILITRIAELLFNTDMDGVRAYERLNLNTATGVYLDLIGNRRGITRIQGSPQLLYVKVKSVASNFQSFSIPEGTVFTMVDGGDSFVTQYIQTITKPEAQIQLAYTESGDSSAIVGSKLQVTGFGQITDLEVETLVEGQGRESDLSYRKRLHDEYPAATTTVEWVMNMLLESPLVRAVGVNYNDQDTEQGGLKPYCTEWMAVPITGVVDDAFLQEVGSIILKNKTPGAPTDGNTSTIAADAFGALKTVYFTVPTKIELEIDVRLTTPETTGFLDLTNVNEIRSQMAFYINNLEIGKDVSYSRLAAPLFADTGFDVAYFKIRKKGGDWLDNQNFDIGEREYAAIAETDITIGV